MHCRTNSVEQKSSKRPRHLHVARKTVRSGRGNEYRPRDARSHAQRLAFVNGSDHGAPAAPRLGNDAQIIEGRVVSLKSGRLLDRYHELVDKRLLGTLQYTELFELERIEVRLNAEDEGEVEQMKAVQENWRRERANLVAAVEGLLVRLKAAD